MFHISHYLWAKKTVKKVEDNIYDFYITRSDWIFYFLLKKQIKGSYLSVIKYQN